jgi:ketosteroid isomerase-like protein
MKIIRFWIMMLLILLSCSISARAEQPADSKTLAQKEIITVLNNFTSAWNQGDLKKALAAYSSDALYIHNGFIRGYQNILASYQERYGKNETRQEPLVLHSLPIKVLSDKYALAVGQYDVFEKEKNKHVTGFFSLLFEKINGEWKIRVDHSC